MTPSPSLPGTDKQPQPRRNLRRWIIPIGGGLLSAVLIVIGTPHVAWYLRVVLAAVAFLYIGGQSAAYLWSSHSDQG
ncbi:MAG TPA: hypothetical protein VII89_09680 [Candidatus Dormibacteraeota bacterium]